MADLLIRDLQMSDINLFLDFAKSKGIKFKNELFSCEVSPIEKNCTSLAEAAGETPVVSSIMFCVKGRFCGKDSLCYASEIKKQVMEAFIAERKAKENGIKFIEIRYYDQSYRFPIDYFESMRKSMNVYWVPIQREIDDFNKRNGKSPQTRHGWVGLSKNPFNRGRLVKYQDKVYYPF